MTVTATPVGLAALTTNINVAIFRAVRAGFPNSGQVCILNAVALLQVQSAAAGHTNGYEGATRSQVVALTNLSESTCRSHIKFWRERGVLDATHTGVGDAYVVRVAK